MKLSTFTMNLACQLDVLWHNGHMLCMDDAQVDVFKEINQVGLIGLLQGTTVVGFVTQISFEILRDFRHQTLEWHLADQQLGWVLVATNFMKRHIRTITGFLAPLVDGVDLKISLKIFCLFGGHKPNQLANAFCRHCYAEPWSLVR